MPVHTNKDEHEHAEAGKVDDAPGIKDVVLGRSHTCPLVKGHQMACPPIGPTSQGAPVGVVDACVPPGVPRGAPARIDVTAMHRSASVEAGRMPTWQAFAKQEGQGVRIP
jgi:hypothetical protein